LYRYTKVTITCKHADNGKAADGANAELGVNDRFKNIAKTTSTSTLVEDAALFYFRDTKTTYDARRSLVVGVGVDLSGGDGRGLSLAHTRPRVYASPQLF
jgi:hypothetical protein